MDISLTYPLFQLIDTGLRQPIEIAALTTAEICSTYVAPLVAAISSSEMFNSLRLCFFEFAFFGVKCFSNNQYVAIVKENAALALQAAQLAQTFLSKC